MGKDFEMPWLPDPIHPMCWDWHEPGIGKTDYKLDEHEQEGENPIMATEVEVKALEMFREMVTKPEFLATMRGVIEAEAYKYVEELAESLFDAHEAILEAHRDIAELEEVTNDNIGFMAEKFD